MIILARPSVSPYLSKTLFELGEPAILAEDIKVPMKPALRLEPAQVIVDRPKQAYQSLILTSSENALAFLQEAIPHDDRVLKARLFKDKVAFRRSLARRARSSSTRRIGFSSSASARPTARSG